MFQAIKLRRAFGVALCLAPIVAQAGVFKCVDAKSGQINYSDRPCMGQEAGRYIETRPNSIDTYDMRERGLRLEVQQLREELQRRDVAEPQYGRTQPDLQAERIDTRACEQARWEYESEANSIRNNKAAVEARRSAMYGACGMREPDKIEVILGAGATVSGHGWSSVIERCDDRGCYDNFGNRFWSRGPGTYDGPSGRCRIRRNVLSCP